MTKQNAKTVNTTSIGFIHKTCTNFSKHLINLTKILFSYDIKFPASNFSQQYQSFRSDTKGSDLYLMSKWNLNKITSETGHETFIQQNNEIAVKDITKFYNFQLFKQRNAPIFEDVKLAVNSQRTGWEALKFDQDTQTKIMVKKLQPCTFFVYSLAGEWSGGLNLISDRNLGDKTEKINMDFQKNIGKLTYMGYGDSRYLALCTIFSKSTFKLNTTIVFISKK